MQPNKLSKLAIHDWTKVYSKDDLIKWHKIYTP